MFSKCKGKLMLLLKQIDAFINKLLVLSRSSQYMLTIFKKVYTWLLDLSLDPMD